MLIAVAGASTPSPEEAEAAFETGRLLATRGVLLICGGLSGVMDQVARGAHGAGGTSIGFLPGNDYQGASSSLSIAIRTGLGQVRNIVLARACDGMIAIGGGYGTLTEIAFALRLGKPVATLLSWSFEHKSMPADQRPYVAQSAADAVEWLLGHMSNESTADG